MLATAQPNALAIRCIARTWVALSAAQRELATAQQQALNDADIISEQQGQVSTLTQARDGVKPQLGVADAQIATLQWPVAALQASI